MPLLYYNNNIIGTLNLLNAMTRHGCKEVHTCLASNSVRAYESSSLNKRSSCHGGHLLHMHKILWDSQVWHKINSELLKKYCKIHKYDTKSTVSEEILCDSQISQRINSEWILVSSWNSSVTVVFYLRNILGCNHVSVNLKCMNFSMSSPFLVRETSFRSVVFCARLWTLLWMLSWVHLFVPFYKAYVKGVFEMTKAMM